jgi:type IV pilus assembly protein PilN
MAALQKNAYFIEINLLPLESRHKKWDVSWLSDVRVMWSTFAIILVALVLGLLYFHVIETTGELEKAVEQTKQAVEKERPLLEKIKDLDEKLAIIKQKSDALRSIQVSRKRWVLLFEDLSTALPPGTWIVGVNQNVSQMTVNCRTWNFSEVALYMLKLEQKESVVSVSLTNIAATNLAGENAYEFSLSVEFNPNLGLEEGMR